MIGSPLGRTFIFGLSLLTAGCAGKSGTTTAPIESSPRAVEVASLEAGLDRLAGLPLNDPERDPLQARLVQLIVDEMPDPSGQHGVAGAMQRLQNLALIFDASEMRPAIPRPRLTVAARRLFDAAARRGHEDAATFALAVIHAFGSDVDREFVAEQWPALEEWYEATANLGRDPTRSTNLQRSLELVAAFLPGPWAVERLDRQYARRIAETRDPARSATENRSRIEFLAYLRIRVHLRANDLERATAVGRDAARSKELGELVQLLESAAKTGSSVASLVELIERFEPENAERLTPWTAMQSWSIVANLARRILAQRDDHVRARLALGRSLAHTGLARAAVGHYEAALGDADEFTPWSELAELYHVLTENDVEENLAVAEKRLQTIEAFYRRAAKLWPQRPLSPSLSDVFVLVAEAMIERGRVGDARTLLDRSLALSPLPSALELVGRIELRNGNFPNARTKFESILALPFEDQLWRMHWEIRTRLHLGEVARFSDDPDELERQLGAAVRQLDTILQLPQIPSAHRSSLLVEHCRARFLLGHVDRAMADFRAASDLTPDTPTVYSTALSLAVMDRRWAAAEEIYLRAMSRSGLEDRFKLYFSLWMLHFAGHEESEAVARARSYVSGFDGDGWVRHLAAHSSGKTSFDALLGRATRQGERAEAYFYAGLIQLERGDRDGASELLQRVLETQMVSFVEYEMAQQILVRMGQ